MQSLSKGNSIDIWTKKKQNVHELSRDEGSYPLAL